MTRSARGPILTAGNGASCETAQPVHAAAGGPGPLPRMHRGAAPAPGRPRAAAPDRARGLLGPWRRRGAGAVEFAILAPLIALIMMGAVDLMLFMRAQVKLEATAVQVGQVVSQCDRITTPGDTADFWRLATTSLGGVAEVTSLSATTVIISGVNNVSNANRVAWQVKSKSAATSAIGAAGGAATIPGGFIVPTGQLMIVTEVSSPSQIWQLSRLLMGLGIVTPTLTARTSYLSRTSDPATVTTAPQSSSTKVCMA